MVFLFAGCSRSTAVEDVTPDSAEQHQPGKEDIAAQIASLLNQPIELSIYESSSGYTQEMFMELYGNALVRKYPNMTYKLYSPHQDNGGLGLPELIAQGVKLDLIKASGASFYTLLVDNGLEDDISDLIEKYHYDLDQFHPAVLQQMRMYGSGKEIYGIPNAVAATALFYNQDIFNKFAVPYPKDRMTWDDIYELARRLSVQEAGVSYLGFQENISFLTITNQLSESFLDPKTNRITIHTDKWRKFILNFARFHEIEGNAMLASYNNAMWKEGRVAMAVGSSGGSWNFTFEAPFNWDLVELPVFKDLPTSGSGQQVPFHAISKTSQHRDQAFLIAAHIASEEFQREFAKLGYVPPIKIEGLQELLGASVPQLQGKNIKAAVPLEIAAPPFPTNGYQSVIAGYVNNAYRAVARGEKDVNTALREAQELAEKKLQEVLSN